MDARPGTYALLLRARSGGRIQIGRCGSLAVRPGWYVYVGSAFGPGGLRARLRHHCRLAERPHWHIDYLRRALRPSWSGIATTRSTANMAGQRAWDAWTRRRSRCPASGRLTATVAVTCSFSPARPAWPSFDAGFTRSCRATPGSPRQPWPTPALTRWPTPRKRVAGRMSGA